MRSFRLIPDNTHIGFMRYRTWAYAFSAALVVLTVLLVPLKGLNFGIDFRGGILMEVRMPGEAADLAAMRATLGQLGLGEVALQEFGEPTDVLIRVERQEGGEEAQQAAVAAVRAALDQNFGGDISYRRVEFVGPKVSSELFWAGTQAVIYALIAILAYIWFRFEWQYSVGAIVALVHDTVTTIGLFALLGLEFNLASVAALLTIVGYSLNDTVVVYDRVRENLRKYKAMPLSELLDRSINETLARTVMTSGTTLLALLALATFGGPVIRGFTIAMIWGVLIGTYSTVYVATPMLVHFNLRRAGAPARRRLKCTSIGVATARRRPLRRRRPERREPALDLTPAVPAGRQLIEGYASGSFRIAGVQHAGSVLVLPDRTLSWPVEGPEDITVASLAAITAAEPAVEILIVGLGQRFGLVAPELRAALRRDRITIEAMTTGAACRTYNVLLTEDRRVAAALIAL